MGWRRLAERQDWRSSEQQFVQDVLVAKNLAGDCSFKARERKLEAETEVETEAEAQAKEWKKVQ